MELKLVSDGATHYYVDDDNAVKFLTQSDYVKPIDAADIWWDKVPTYINYMALIHNDESCNFYGFTKRPRANDKGVLIADIHAYPLYTVVEHRLLLGFSRRLFKRTDYFSIQEIDIEC